MFEYGKLTFEQLDANTVCVNNGKGRAFQFEGTPETSMMVLNMFLNGATYDEMSTWVHNVIAEANGRKPRLS